MRFSFLIIAVLTFGWSWAQFQFNGQVSKDYRNKQVYLSLVEDYRKTSRVYLDQIFQHTTADSLGYFSFTGDNLPLSNRIYRIHVDACDTSEGHKNHFLGVCTEMESILFIANNRDTLSLPVGDNKQAFCEINSTNRVSDALLQLDFLKEELIVDILEQPSEMAKNLSFKKWIKQFQNTSLQLNEPLAELYVFSFLSNRGNETYSHYLQDLEESAYYDGLAGRLQENYQKASFTEQYKKELQADRTLISDEQISQSSFDWRYMAYTVLGLAVLSTAFFTYKKWKTNKNHNPFETLSPQERKVLNAILEGKSNKEIATDFFISLSTVKSHINSLYKKLGMSSRSEILSFYKGKR
jgi:DNA-binding CsgD family transcriptional regulator